MTEAQKRIMEALLAEHKRGALTEARSDPDEWPYQTPLDAVRDGWRIISFPNMALLTVEEEEFYGLGFEFILERWR